MNIAFFTIANLYISVGSFIVFSPKYWTTSFNPEAFDTKWALVLKMLYASQGFVLPLTRISEPYFYQIVTTKFKAALQHALCCCGSEARRLQAEADERFNDQTFLKRNLLKLASIAS